MDYTLLLLIILVALLLVVIGLIIFFVVKGKRKPVAPFEAMCAPTVPTPASTPVTKPASKPVSKPATKPASTPVPVPENKSTPIKEEPKIDSESIYQFSAAPNKKICPCCTCENQQIAVCCEVCGVSF